MLQPHYILDSHIHLFDASRAEGIPWPVAGDLIYQTYLADDVEKALTPLMINKAIAIEASAWFSDNQWLLNQVNQSDFYVGCVGNLDINSAEFSKQFEQFKYQEKYLGIRYGNLWGGLTTNAIYCVFLNLKNKSYTDYTNTSTPLLLNYLLVALAGTLWYLQFFFYGMGESRLNNEASSWILHMSFIILTSNLWGFYFGEWKGTSSKNRKVIYLGILVILISVCLVGYGNYLNHY